MTASTKSSPELLVLNASDVTKAVEALSLDELLANQSDAFANFSSARAASSSSSSSDEVSPVQCPARTPLLLPNHTTLFMPSRSSAGTAIKIVSVPRGESADGLPGSNIVINEKTGRVEAMLNSAELTGLRTAAGSAVASQLLLGKGEGRKTIVAFGAGVQAFWHIHLHIELFSDVQEVILVGRPSSTPSARTTALASRLTALHPKLKVSNSSSPGFDRGQAVHNADIIFCCTPSTTPLFPATQPHAGAHLVLVGSYKPHMFEVEPEMLKRTGVAFVDGKAEVLHEAGEFQKYEGDLTEVGSVCGKGQESKAKEIWTKAGGDLTMFKSVGLAVQDVAITMLVLAKARKLGLGSSVPF